MKELHKKLGKITDAWFGIEQDRGFLTFSISFDYDDFGCQSFTGYALCEWDEKLNRRKGTACGADAAIQILSIFNAKTFEALKGRVAYALCDNDGLSGMIRGIEVPKFDGGGRFTTDEWLELWGIEN